MRKVPAASRSGERTLAHRNAHSPGEPSAMEARFRCPSASASDPPSDRCVREDDPLVGHRGPYALRRALHGARPPGLVLVCEPDELGLERTHPQLAFGVRLVELAE